MEITLPKEIRLFSKSKLGANLHKNGFHVKAGTKVMLGEPFNADFDHRTQLAVKVDGLETDEDVYAIVSEIGPLNTRKETTGP